jgi:hypothetical protein
MNILKNTLTVLVSLGVLSILAVPALANQNEQLICTAHENSSIKIELSDTSSSEATAEITNGNQSTKQTFSRKEIDLASNIVVNYSSDNFQISIDFCRDDCDSGVIFGLLVTPNEKLDLDCRWE